MSQARRNHLKTGTKSCPIDQLFVLFYFNISRELLQKQKLIGGNKNNTTAEYFPHPISVNSITKTASNFSFSLE